MAAVREERVPIDEKLMDVLSSILVSDFGAVPKGTLPAGTSQGLTSVVDGEEKKTGFRASVKEFFQNLGK